jgi:hypothetical protein
MKPYSALCACRHECGARPAIATHVFIARCASLSPVGKVRHLRRVPRPGREVPSGPSGVCGGRWRVETRLPPEPDGIRRRRKRAVVDRHGTGQAHCTGWMLGMIRLRGRITPVCDIVSRLGTAYEISGQGRIVIIEADAAMIGLIVETVEEVLTVAEDRIEPAQGRSWPAADRRTRGPSDPDPAAATTQPHRSDPYRRTAARQSHPHVTPDRSRSADCTLRPHRAQTMTR